MSLERRRELARMTKPELIDFVIHLERAVAALNSDEWMRRLIASVGGYFWLPCDRCARHFGGHENGWKPRNVNIPGDTLLCPRCANREDTTEREDGGAER